MSAFAAFVLAAAVLSAEAARAEPGDPRKRPPAPLEEGRSRLASSRFGLTAGWGGGLPVPHHDDGVADSRFVALGPRWALPVCEDCVAGLAGRLDVVVEGLVLLQHAPSGGWASGGNAWLRHDFAGRGRLRPYLEAGGGALYLDFDLRDQADGLSYSLVGGAGLRWPLARALTLDTGVRYHHVSNAGRRSPNTGLDALLLTVGVSWGPRLAPAQAAATPPSMESTAPWTKRASSEAR